jgi:SAM-dependent methyltransferase
VTAHNDPYDSWAWLYNSTMGPDYGREQYALLERVLLPNVAEGAAILDLCCGTGQLIQPLLDAGYRVTGLDASEEMLHFAKENAPGADYLHEDARRFSLPARFDAVFSTSASLNHILSLEDLNRVFANVRNALRDGGTFVFDLNHLSQLGKWWHGQPTEGRIEAHHAWMVTPHYEKDEQRGRFTVTIFRQPRQGTDGLLSRSLRRPLYRLLDRPRFIGLRLKLLGAFDRFEPDWQREEIDFPVQGHDLAAVGQLLRAVGFEGIRIETIDGKELDDDHSAHFICTKTAGTRA